MNVGIIGAGMSGLMAARRLAQTGHTVTLFDKGRSVGGRLATRRLHGAHFDHGAQFFTVRDDVFAEHVRAWIADEVVFEWCRGFSADGDGYPRYAVRGGMNALAKHLAVGLDVRCDSLAFSLHTEAEGWTVKLDDASLHSFDALIVTCPLPQAFSLLVSAEVSMPESLWQTDYDRTLCLLVVLDGPSQVPAPGGIQHDPNFTFVGDNSLKGISALPALTLHANPEWSALHWDDDPGLAADALAELAGPWLGAATIVRHQLKRWRFATPRTVWPTTSWSPDEMTSLAVAGDAFAGPRVEGAALSGLAAANALLG